MTQPQPALIFQLKDQDGTFSVSVETLIECLQVADQLGEIPPLPEAWKDQIPDIHRVKLER